MGLFGEGDSYWDNIYAVRRGQRRRRRERLVRARAEATHDDSDWDFIKHIYDHRCVRCWKFGYVQKDHVVPISLGGNDGVMNIQPLCPACHAKKGLKTWDFRPQRLNKLSDHRRRIILDNYPMFGGLIAEAA